MPYRMHRRTLTAKPPNRPATQTGYPARRSDFPHSDTAHPRIGLDTIGTAESPAGGRTAARDWAIMRLNAIQGHPDHEDLL